MSIATQMGLKERRERDERERVRVERDDRVCARVVGESRARQKSLTLLRMRSEDFFSTSRDLGENSDKFRETTI